MARKGGTRSYRGYLNLIREMNPSGRLQYYPGSPFIAEKVLRSQDRLRLYELHPAEIQNLAKNFQELAKQEQLGGGRPAGVENGSS